MMDGVSIFVNRKKFNIINYEQIDLAQFFASKHYFEQTPDLEKRLASRNTVAVIAVLEHIPTKATVFVSNTHLYWSPKHPDVKLMQTFLLTQLLKRAVQRQFKLSEEETEEILKGGHNLNVFMVGDFNSAPDSPVYRFLTQGKVDMKQEKEISQFNYGSQLPSALSTPFDQFNSPYKALFEEDKFLKTTYTQKFKRIIDYIWFNKSSDQLELIKVLGDIESQYLEHYPGFPNPEFPSDHFPILAEFELKA
ncbi:unnamed protein product [Ambrosiozyma monospora]|uniref:Unnamed protein product n=1 Tax=Ambrosiozyma monospora TaxID=43982 RepID=A0ACB5TFQ0_AMBMO|nr:unnamed protein product [Ambrosiozyma monospora]